MKATTTILALFLTLNLSAIDSLAQFKYDFMNLEISCSTGVQIVPPLKKVNQFQWKPTIIFAVTFVAIQLIISYDSRNGFRNTSWKTAPIFLAGMAGCLLTYKF